jgi:ABC-type maltose transport system permease subunit
MIVVYDGAYDKLIVHGFQTHAGIDGASHDVLWAKVTLDKRKHIIFEGYASIVKFFGPHVQIKSNFVIEHIIIKEHTVEPAKVGIRNIYVTNSFTKN